MRKSLYILVIFALLVQPSLGTLPIASAREMGERAQAPEQTTLYVKPGGTGDCTSWGEACGLQTALWAATPGDEIWVAQGIYKPTDGIPYSSCQEIRDAVPDSPDGEYLIDIGGNAAQVYCADMASEPKEYLTLSGENYSQYTAGGASPGTDVRTTYTRVRLLPDTSQVDTSDQSYSSSTGSLYHGDTLVTSMPYAVAMDCFNFDSSTGEARIDLRYTAFAVSASETFSLGGYFPAGTATLSEDNQVVQMTGGGYCGWMNPSPGVYQPFNNRGGPILELEYRPERRAAFRLKIGVGLYGGFDPDSGVDTFEERNPADYITVLSGDIDGNDITDPNGVVTDTDYIVGSNAYHVVTASGVDGTAILDGFTITAGMADGDWPVGGGMNNQNGSPSITNVTFSGNYALYHGGGMGNMPNSSPTLMDVIFYGNTAGNAGGGMMIALNSSPRLINVTFSGNSAYMGGGIYNETSDPSLTNTILWGNSPDQFNDGYQSVPIISYSDIQGGYPGTGNLDADPLFVDAAGGDLHLSPGSPVIDAGDNAAPDLPLFDFEGDPRIVDGDHDGMPTVDMGADEFYEAPPPVIYVDQDASGANSGVSWEDALTGLQAALAWAESGTEIWVAQGVYTPTLETDPGDVRSATFRLEGGVALYGGFDPQGGADTFVERNPAAYPSVLSGDIDGVAGHDGNAYHVVTGSAVEAMASLDGFTITAGYAWVFDGGGGVYNPVGSLDIQNTTLIGNEAYMGGGIFNTGTLTVTHSLLSDNWAGYGGGIANYLGGSLTLLTSTVGPGNNVYTMGGGVHNEGSMVIFDSTIVGNSGTGSVGGAGIANLGTLEVTNSTISGNFTNVDGGGIWHAGGLLMLNNATITANIADHDQLGGGVGAGIFQPGGGPILATNTIIANNLVGGVVPSDCAPLGLPLLSLGYNLDSDGSCLLMPGPGDKPFTNPLLGPLADHGGPTLTHALLPGSPAIDAGSCPGYPADQRGYPRPVDFPDIPNAIGGDGCDMGALEVQLPLLYLPLMMR